MGSSSRAAGISGSIARSVTARPSEVYLPQATAPASSIRPIPDLVLAPQDSGTILLVEDESLVRALASRILRARGYHVPEAHDGRSALRIATDHQGQIDVLLTDVIMPGGLSGPQVANRLLDQQPGLRVLYMSGYTDAMIAHHAAFDSRQNLLQNPLPPQGWRTRCGMCGIGASRKTIIISQAQRSIDDSAQTLASAYSHRAAGRTVVRRPRCPHRAGRSIRSG